jgi:hypothetical protein
MSEINLNIDDNNKIILNQNTVNESKNNPEIIHNIKLIISNILNTIDNNSYTEEDKFELEKCLFSIQYKLKSKSIPTNVKSGLNKVYKMMDNISSSFLNNSIGELYNLNNCLHSFNEKINKPLYKTKNQIINNSNISEVKHTTVYLKTIVYLFVISIVVYLFYYHDEN